LRYNENYAENGIISDGDVTVLIAFRECGSTGKWPKK
jgi:hypothetical protein